MLVCGVTGVKQTFSFPTGLIPRTLGPLNVFILLNGWINFVYMVC